MDVRKRLKRELFSRIYEDRGGENDFVFIAGSGRSGTTWIADTLCRMYDFRLIFEPFWHLHLEVDGNKDFFHHRFIEPGNEAYDKKIRSVLSGDYRNFRSNHHYRYGPYEGRVIKDICSNLFLKRIRALYPEIPILYMLRNPFSVVSSRLRKKDWAKPWGWHAHLFNEQELLRSQCNLESKIAPENELEDHIISYCYENYLPLKWYLKNKSIFKLVIYEEILINPKQGFNKISEFLNSYERFQQQRSLEEINDSFKMSSKDSQKKIKKNKKIQLSKWKDDLSQDQIKRISEILLEFKYDKLFKKIGLNAYIDF